MRRLLSVISEKQLCVHALHFLFSALGTNEQPSGEQGDGPSGAPQTDDLFGRSDYDLQLADGLAAGCGPDPDLVRGRHRSL